MSHANGALAEPPIALAEVQGYAYAALIGAAELATVLGDDARRRRLRARGRSSSSSASIATSGFRTKASTRSRSTVASGPAR